MNWPKAMKQIKATIRVGTDLNTDRSSYRFVVAVGRLGASARYRYRGDKGFVVQIGTNSVISIPWRMLQLCFAALECGRGYDGTFFRSYFPLQASDHGCHVHVVGQILMRGGLARQEGDRYVASWMPDPQMCAS